MANNLTPSDRDDQTSRELLQVIDDLSNSKGEAQKERVVDRLILHYGDRSSADAIIQLTKRAGKIEETPGNTLRRTFQ